MSKKIYIKPSKRGSFTREAKKRGLSVQEFASRVLKNKSRYSKAMVKKAVFAKNSRKWKREMGGELAQAGVSTALNIGSSLFPPLEFAIPAIEGLLGGILDKSNDIKQLKNHFKTLGATTNPYGLEHGGAIGEEDVFQYKGPSHDSPSGGIAVTLNGIPDIDGDVLVEGDEVLYTVGDRRIVFSKKLKI